MAISRADALRRGVQLEVASIAWMLVEAVVALGAGFLARSVLLTTFGFDSVIELLSAVVVLRRLQGRTGEGSATRISALLLVLLCGYVVVFSIGGLVFRVVPSESTAGLLITFAAIVLMPALAWAKRRVNRVLESPSLKADIAESISCAYLAAVTLAGLVVAAVTGWWWVEYLGAAALLLFLVPETREALEEWRHNGLNHGGKGFGDE